MNTRSQTQRRRCSHSELSKTPLDAFVLAWLPQPQRFSFYQPRTCPRALYTRLSYLVISSLIWTIVNPIDTHSSILGPIYFKYGASQTSKRVSQLVEVPRLVRSVSLIVNLDHYWAHKGAQLHLKNSSMFNLISNLDLSSPSTHTLEC